MVTVRSPALRAEKPRHREARKPCAAIGRKATGVGGEGGGAETRFPSPCSSRAPFRVKGCEQGRLLPPGAEISVLQQSLLPPDVLQNLPGPLEGARPSERVLDVRGLGVGGTRPAADQPEGARGGRYWE